MVFATGGTMTGNGTAGSPYLVQDYSDLKAISAWSYSWSAVYRLANDIDASASSGGGFLPIGSSTAVSFTGTFHGAGHVIKNLYINYPSLNGVGLFGYTNSAVIDSLGVLNANITGDFYVGGVAGYTILGTVTDCYVTGNVSGGGSMVGGVVGENYEATAISNCHSTANVTSSGTMGAGGLVGNNISGTIDDCYATGIVTGSEYVGGIAGLSQSGTIRNCYATGNVTGGSYVGGAVGLNDYTVYHCYACGVVTGSSYVGGFVGKSISPVTVASCFWDNVTSGQATSVGSGDSTGITGESTANMKTESTFTTAGWDFSGVWAISSGINNGYPYLLGVTDIPLGVEATSFEAKADAESVTLTWKTQSEVDNAGFNILREDLQQAGQSGTTSGSTSLTAAFKLISSYTSNSSLKGLGTSSSGRAYDFTDDKVVSGKTYRYKIQSVSTNGTTKDLTTLSVTVDIPRNYALYQNYPNPFNPSTVISYQLPVNSAVILKVFDVLGREVQALVNERQSAGDHSVTFYAENLPSGVYFYKLVASGVEPTTSGGDGQKFVAIRKLVLMK